MSLRLPLITLLLCWQSALIADDMAMQSDTDPYAEQALGLIGDFSSQLKQELKTALKEDGPVHAIAVCKERAPEITAAMSQETGWTVRRVSLKARNQTLGVPDVWETSILNQFEDHIQDGLSAQQLTASVIETDQNGQRVYRYMKAIPTAQVCLACHGQHLAPEIASALETAYPDDQARGYELDQLRGAFSLSKPISE
jgi:hypothetical protein